MGGGVCGLGVGRLAEKAFQHSMVVAGTQGRSVVLVALWGFPLHLHVDLGILLEPAIFPKFAARQLILNRKAITSQQTIDVAERDVEQQQRVDVVNNKT